MLAIVGKKPKVQNSLLRVNNQTENRTILDA